MLCLHLYSSSATCFSLIELRICMFPDYEPHNLNISHRSIRSVSCSRLSHEELQHEALQAPRVSKFAAENLPGCCKQRGLQNSGFTIAGLPLSIRYTCQFVTLTGRFFGYTLPRTIATRVFSQRRSAVLILLTLFQGEYLMHFPGNEHRIPQGLLSWFFIHNSTSGSVTGLLWL